MRVKEIKRWVAGNGEGPQQESLQMKPKTGGLSPKPDLCRLSEVVKNFIERGLSLG